MVVITALSVLAVAGSVIAAPAAKFGSAIVAREAGSDDSNYGYKYARGAHQPSSTEDDNPSVVYEDKIVVVTEYVEASQGHSDNGGDHGRPADKPQPTLQPEPQPQPEVPALGGVSKSFAKAPSTDGGSASGYIGIVNKYRAEMGLPDLVQDSTLESNAIAASAIAGDNMEHHLNPGSLSQVLGPGVNNLESFEHVFAGGWICEIPSLISGCAEKSQGWKLDGKIVHAEALTNTAYTKIGCGITNGSESKDIWACDLA